MKYGSQARERANLFAELADVIAREARAFGLADDAAQCVAVSACDAIAQSFGGLLLYIPRSLHAQRIAARDAALIAAAATQSIEQLARVHGLSVHTVYRILARERAKREARE